jgi:hypothetical protein
MTTVQPDTIRPFTRWVGIGLLPFLVVAAFLLYVLPGLTETTFAWTIHPDLTAMMLGCAYIGGIRFFLAVAFRRRWNQVREGFPAVFVFATLLLIATLLHWDRFHHGHPSFVVWLILYVAAPVLIAVAAILNRGGGVDGHGSTSGGLAIPGFARYALAALGVVSIGAGLWLFAVPQFAIDFWPWQLTPLTARVVGAILTLPGFVNLWLVVDPRWSGFRWLLQSQLISLVAIVIALVVRRDDLDGSRPSTGIVVGGLVVSFAAYLVLYVFMERRARASR